MPIETMEQAGPQGRITRLGELNPSERDEAPCVFSNASTWNTQASQRKWTSYAQFLLFRFWSTQATRWSNPPMSRRQVFFLSPWWLNRALLASSRSPTQHKRTADANGWRYRPITRPIVSSELSMTQRKPAYNRTSFWPSSRSTTGECDLSHGPLTPLCTADIVFSSRPDTRVGSTQASWLYLGSSPTGNSTHRPFPPPMEMKWPRLLLRENAQWLLPQHSSSHQAEGPFRPLPEDCSSHTACSKGRAYSLLRRTKALGTSNIAKGLVAACGPVQHFHLSSEAVWAWSSRLKW